MSKNINIMANFNIECIILGFFLSFIKGKPHYSFECNMLNISSEHCQYLFPPADPDHQLSYIFNELAAFKKPPMSWTWKTLTHTHNNDKCR